MRRLISATVIALCACAVAAGCGDDDDTYYGPGGDTDVDSDVDTDIDTDSDSDSDTDTVDEECLGNDVAVYDVEDMEAIAGYPCIEGDLTVQGADLTTLALPVLEEIYGALTIAGNPALDALAMESLYRVDDAITVSDNTALAGCDICDLLDQIDEQPDAGVPEVTGNLEDECTPVPENCP